MRWKYFYTVASWIFLLRVFLPYVYRTFRDTDYPEFEGSSTLPANLSDYLNSSIYAHRLIDFDNFEFKMNVPSCPKNPSPSIVILVHSAPTHFEHRSTIRHTWGSAAEKVVFLLGSVENQDLQKKLTEEHRHHHDIVQGNFLDTYRNLTYKQVMALKWVSHFCLDAHYVFKVDDDVFVDIPQLNDYLQENYGSWAPSNLLTCYVFRDPFAKRSHRSKWRVSFKEYAKAYYPSYCSGFVVGLSPVVAARMYVESFNVPYFWIDDVFVTGMLAQRLGVSHKDLTGVIDSHPATTVNYISSLLLSPPPMLGAADLDQDTIKALWLKSTMYYKGKKSDP